MAKVCNSFEIKLDDQNYADKVKAAAETLFREVNYKMQDEFLVWDAINGNAAEPSPVYRPGVFFTLAMMSGAGSGASISFSEL